MPIEPSEFFKPLSWKRVTDGESVRMAEPTFFKWMGPSPGSNYGGKPIAGYDGRPAFGELVILRTCMANGWEGVWVRHAGGKTQYCREFWPKPAAVGIPPEVQQFLDDVASARGGTFGGTWDGGTAGRDFQGSVRHLDSLIQHQPQLALDVIVDSAGVSSDIRNAAGAVLAQMLNELGGVDSVREFLRTPGSPRVMRVALERLLQRPWRSVVEDWRRRVERIAAT
jgi:hypothetical protein